MESKSAPASQSPQKASEVKKDATTAQAGVTAPQTDSLTPQQIEEKLRELKQGFSRLGNKEKELEKKSQELEFYVKNFPALKAQAEEADRLKELLKSDPIAAAKAIGADVTQTYGKMAAGMFKNDPASQQLSQLSQTIEKLQKKLDEVESSRTKEQEERKRAEFLNQVKEVSKKFKVISSSESYGVVEQMLAKLKADGEDADLEKAAAKAEDLLRTEIKKVLKAKAFDKEELLALLEDAAEAKAEAESKAPEKPAPKKIFSDAKKEQPSSSDSDSPAIERPKTWEEARRRANQTKLLRAIAEQQASKKAK